MGLPDRSLVRTLRFSEFLMLRTLTYCSAVLDSGYFLKSFVSRITVGWLGENWTMELLHPTFLTETGINEQFCCSDRILTCRIKSICSPAKGGTGCYRFNYQPGS